MTLQLCSGLTRVDDNSALCQQANLFAGLHQVRSITLDTRVWDEPVLSMMASIGNTAANAIWEERLTALPAAASGAWDKDVWSADADDEGPG